MNNASMMIIIAVVFIAAIIGLIVGISQREQLRRYDKVTLGMSESEMLKIMGKGYNRSLLKNNRVKYEWRINATSRSTRYKGMSITSHSGVHKVDIYVKDGVVEEVRPYNVT